MSDGVARHIKEKFELSDIIEHQKSQHSVGSIVEVKQGNRYILNLITKEKSVGKPTWKDFKQSIKALPEKCNDLGIKKLCIPKIGSGLDGLNWDKSMKLLKNVFKDSDTELTVLSLTKEEEKHFKISTRNNRFKASQEKDGKLILLGDSHIKGLQYPMMKRTPSDMTVECYPDGGANAQTQAKSYWT